MLVSLCVSADLGQTPSVAQCFMGASLLEEFGNLCLFKEGCAIITRRRPRII